MECFNTIRNEVSAEQVIDKSRFIAIVAKLTNTAEAESHMQKMKLEFPNARHYVYAYRLFGGKLEKASDDGEPQGTGGRPILDILQHRQIWNVQIIVVRYFGGILLGTGGLTRAYGGTARLALEKAGVTRLVPTFSYRLQIPYTWYEQIKYGLKQKGWANDNEQFGENISSNAYIPKKETATFEAWLDELTNKQVLWEKREIVMKPERISNDLKT
jgi:uncharacterized YigZ family protein